MPKDRKGKDKAFLFQGSWEITFYEEGGRVSKREQTWCFYDGHMAIGNLPLAQEAIQKSGGWRYKLDLSTSPPQLDFQQTNAGNSWFQCLFDLEDDDTLILVYQTPGKPRAKALNSENNANYLKFRRVYPK